MTQTIFYALPEIESDNGYALDLCHILTSFMDLDASVARFLDIHLPEYMTTYSAGHYGETEHEWIFSHHEVYTPTDVSLPMIVILRYKPVLSQSESKV